MAGSDMTPEEQETLKQEFFDSVYTGTIATTKRLLKRGFPINTQVASYGQADLYLSHDYDYDDVVEAFKLGIQDSYDQTPLFLTCWTGRYDIARLLVKWKADLNRPNREGKTPLIVASRNGHEKIVALLLEVGLEQGIDVNAQDSTDFTALWQASCFGHHTIVRLLLNYGANVNLANNEGCTPLLAVSFYGHPKVVPLLLKHGANVNLPKNNGFTPLIAASQEGHLQIIELLVDAGAKLDPKHSDTGNTALHFAIINNKIEAAELLIDCGANLFAESNDGSTSLDLAESEEIKARLLMRCKLYETRKELATLKSFVLTTSFGNISSTNIQLATLQGEVEKLRREMTKLRKNRDTAQLRREMTKVKKENARLQRDHEKEMAQLRQDHQTTTTYLILAVVLIGLVMVVGFLIVLFRPIG